MKKISGNLRSLFGRVEKRIRFVVATISLCLIMLVSTFFFFDKVWIFIPILIIASIFFTYFAILEGIEKIEWSMLFLMPVLWSVASYLFYFLFPVRWITRLPFMFFYGFSMYAILLTSNIFNVGVARSLQLYRAAFSVNYFYQTVIVFLTFNVLFSFKQNIFINTIGVVFLILPLSMQLFWSIKPKIYLDQSVKNHAMFIAAVIGEVMIFFSFVNVKSTIMALFLTACYYSLSGLLYHYADQKLFKQTIREYVFVAVFVFIIVLLSVQW